MTSTSSLDISSTNTGTLTSWTRLGQITDHKAWMSQILQNGNKPEEWLQFLTQVEESCTAGSDPDSLLCLDQAYRKARESIPVENKQANEALATIFINAADIKRRLKSEGKARYLLRYARANFRGLPMVHMAAAQFELDQGDKAKCISILDKACKLCPNDAKIREALQRIRSGLNSLQEKTETKDIRNVDEDFVYQSLMAFNWNLASFTEGFKHDSNSAFSKVASSASKIKTPRTRSLPQRVPRRVLMQQTPILRNSASDDDDEDEEDGGIVSSSGMETTSPKKRPVELPSQLSAITEDGDSGITVETPPTDDLRQTSMTGPKFPFLLNLGSNEVHPRIARQEEHQEEQRPHPHSLQVHQQSQQTCQQSHQKSQPQVVTMHHSEKGTESSSQANPSQPSQSVHRVTETHQVVPQVTSERKNQINIKGIIYSIIKVIGKGGSSKVYQVLHESSKKIFAVKYVDLECADDVIIQSYKNEITVLQRLQSKEPIIKLYDYEISPTHIYLVMECGSIDLASFLRRKRVEKEDILFYWRQMLMAVQCIHDEGIIHRDLKPANFLFVEGSLKLIDFGIANSIQGDRTSVTRESQVGTLNYMSPETIQSSGDGGHGRNSSSMKINCKSDVWSLGCILYYITYGKTPFQSITNTMMKLQAICNPEHKIQFPEVHDSNLVDVLKKCLIRDVKMRPSIKELLDHPYVTQKPSVKDSPTPVLGVTKGVVETLMSKLNNTNCTSPRSTELAIALQKYLGSHGEPVQDKENRKPLHDVNSTSQNFKGHKQTNLFLSQ